MAELEILILIAVLLYLADCLVIVRRGSVIFRRGWRDWICTRPGDSVSNAHGGLVLSNPLPRYPATFTGGLIPFSVSPSSICSRTSSCLEAAWRPASPILTWRWEAIDQISTDRRYLIVNRARFVAAPSAQTAILWAEILDRVRVLSLPEREAALRKWFTDLLSVEQVESRLRDLSPVVRRLSLQAWTLMVYVGLVLPLSIARWGLAASIWPLLTGLLFQTIFVSALFARSHRRFYPLNSEERFVHSLTLALAPMSAMRAPDLLARRALEGFHPLSTAKHLCRPDEFLALSRHVIRDLHFPILPECPSNLPDCVEAESWSRRAWIDELGRFLQRCGSSLDDALRPPTASEPSHQVYCPRCETQYVDATSVCQECGDRKCVPCATDSSRSNTR